MWAIARALKADFAVTEIELLSPLAYEECMRRIRGEIDGWQSGARPLVGKVRNGWFRARHIKGRNAFQTYLTANLTAHASGTHIRCRFGMHPLAIAFIVYWFGAALVYGLIRSAHDAKLSFVTAAISVVALVVGIGFGLGLVHYGRYEALNEQRYLTDILKTKLDARPV